MPLFTPSDPERKLQVNRKWAHHLATAASHAGKWVSKTSVCAMDACDIDRLGPNTGMHLLMQGVRQENVVCFSSSKVDFQMMERTAGDLMPAAQVLHLRLPEQAGELGERRFDYFICDTCSGRPVVERIVASMVKCMAEHSVLVVGIYCGGRNTPPETVSETSDRFTHFMATLGATPFLPMQSDMVESSCTEGRGMLYLPFQFGTGRHHSLRYHDGIRLLHGEDTATATRACGFREYVEHARDAKATAKATAKAAARELARQKRALLRIEDQSSMRSSTRESKRRLFLSDEQTMGSASKYECIAFQLKKQWEHSCYTMCEKVQYMGDVVTLKGYNHTSGIYSVQYPGSSGLFEAPACHVQPLSSISSSSRGRKRSANDISGEVSAQTDIQKLQERMSMMEQRHAEQMAAMGHRLASLTKDYAHAMAQLEANWCL